MPANLKMRIEPEQGRKMSYQMSSGMHGLLMEMIPAEQAAKLHEQGLRPYSQYLSLEGDTVYWNINTLNEEAFQTIILPLLSEEKDTFLLKKHDMKLFVKERQLRQTSVKSAADLFYSGESGRYFRLKFLTPTAFKQNGQYTIYPDLRCIYQSLMNRYDAVNEKEQLFDEDVLEQLTKDSSIRRYHLKSTSFSLEGVRIPSFYGWILIRVSGTRTMAGFVDLLLHFGEYSGVGIKTSLGMGAVKLMEKEEGGNDGQTY